MSTPREDPAAYGDGYSDYLGAPYGQSPYGPSSYGHGSGYPDAQPGQPSPGAQSPYPYGMPPQYNQAPQYGQSPQFGQPPHYGLPPQYGADPVHGAMQPFAPNYPAPNYPGSAYPVSRKEPAIPLVLSFFLPGLGTIVNGKAGKGVAIMAGYFLGVLLSIVLIGIPIMMGFWIWGMVDAYKGAQKHNAQHGFR